MDFHDFVRRRLPPLTIAREPEIIDELAQHLGDLYEEARAAGMSHERALERAAAAIPERDAALGSEIESASRGLPAIITAKWADRFAPADAPDRSGSRRFALFGDLRRDVRYAMRMLLRTPGFTLVVVLTIALGIGANAAIFSAVDALLLRDAPVADPPRVVSVYTSGTDGRVVYGTSSFADYEDLRNAGALAGLSAFASIAVSFDRSGAVDQIAGEIVSGNYFDVLGVGMALGRGFHASEDVAAQPVRVAVLSHAFWRTRLGGDASIVGQSIVLNGQAFEVVGVAAPRFVGVVLGRPSDVYVPMALQPEMRPPSAGVRRQLGSSNLLTVRGSRWLSVVGRLPPGSTLPQANASADVIARQLQTQYPASNRDRRFTIVRLGEGPGVRATARPLLGVLTGTVAIVLLIACANVAGLLAARAVSRRREVAIRMAVGAARGRLVRQWLTESMLLAILGALGALLVAKWFTPVLYGLGVPDSVELSINPRVLMFTLAAAIASGLVFGLAPVLQALGRDSVSALRDESGSIASGARAARLRAAFIVLQVALSLVLMIGAGLFLRTLKNAYAVDLGYQIDRMLIGDVNLDVRGYAPAAGQETYRRILERLNGLPGVIAAGGARVPVLSGGSRSGGVTGDAPPSPDGSNAVGVRVNVVSDRYLDAMGIPILAGRGFRESDDRTRPRVAIVSRALADRLWPGQDPIARSIYSDPVTAFSVIGVVPNSVYASAIERDPPPVYYVPLAQNYEAGISLHVRAAGDALALVPAVRQAIREVDPQLAFARPRTLAGTLDQSVGDQRLMATLVGLFAALALLLSMVGLYGVMSHAVGQRRAEIGVRLALGAEPIAILSMIVAAGLRLVVLGSVLGLGAALLASRLVQAQLFGVTPIDPLTYVAVVVLLVLVALVACVIPAQRAMRVDPVRALRHG
jgi:predicted permease